MFAECVTKPRTAIVGKAVLVSRVVPFVMAMIAKRTMVMTGANIPRALARQLLEINNWTGEGNGNQGGQTTGIVYRHDPANVLRLVELFFSQPEYVFLYDTLKAQHLDGFGGAQHCRCCGDSFLGCRIPCSLAAFEVASDIPANSRAHCLPQDGKLRLPRRV